MKQVISSGLTLIGGRIGRMTRQAFDRLTGILTANVYFCKHINRLPEGSIVFFPYRPAVLYCGIAALVSVKSRSRSQAEPQTESLAELVDRIQEQVIDNCEVDDESGIADRYLGGASRIDRLWQSIQELKGEDRFTF